MIDMRSEKCKTCVHTKVCTNDLNVVGEMFVSPNPILGNTEEKWERFKKRKAQGFPCDDRLEIVRCKDCIYKRLNDGETKYYYCALKAHEEWSVDETDFCSWGERKGGTE